MKLFLSLTISLFISFTGLFAQNFETNIIPGECIVMLKGEAKKESFIQSITNSGQLGGFEIKSVVSERYKIFVVSFDPAEFNSETALRELQANEFVALAQFNHTIEQRATPNDPSFSTEQWSLNNTGQTGGTPDADIDAPEAWNITTGGLTALGDTIVVAVVDGGMRITHPDLVPNLWRNYQEIPGNGVDDDGNGYIDDINGWDAYANDGSIPNNNHGTHVGGIIGARGNNNLGVSGVNWNIKIMPVAGSSGNEATVVRAYGYVAVMRERYNNSSGTTGAFVVATNSSFGVDFGQASNYPIWCAFYDTLGTLGILNAGAGPNQNTNIDTQGDIPTTCPSSYMIAVTNTTNTDTKNSSSGYGLINMDIGAPGTNVYNTYNASSYQNLTGTSMATPHVAGAIGLYYAAACSLFIEDYKSNPSSIALLMRNYLLTGVDSIPSMSTTTSSKGRLNLYKGIMNVLSYNCSGTPPEASFQSSSTTICAGDTIHYTDQSANNPTTWLWNFEGGQPNVSNLQNPSVVYLTGGSYDVSLIVSNTNGADTISFINTVVVNDNPLPPVITEAGGMLQSSYASGNQWYDQNGMILGETGNTFQPTQNGTYTVVHTSSSGCTSTSEPFQFFAGINGNEMSTISVFPNPTKGIVNFKHSLIWNNSVVKVMEITGKTIFSTQLNQSSSQIDISRFNPGIYLIEINSGSSTKTFRIVKM